MLTIKMYLQVHILYKENEWLISSVWCGFSNYPYKLQEKEKISFFAYPIIFN